MPLRSIPGWFRSNVSILRRVIGLVEVLGAGWSVVGLGGLFLRSGAVMPWSFLFIFLGSYTFVGLAGVLLLRQHRLGEPLSILAQVPQLVQLTSGALAYRFIAGYQVTLFLVGDRFGAYAGLSAAINLWRGTNDPAFMLGVNLIPVVLLALLVLLPTSGNHARPLAGEAS